MKRIWKEIIVILLFASTCVVGKFMTDLNSNVEIVKPKEGYLYIFDREVAAIGITLILGRITIEVEADDADGIDIYIDDELKFSDYTSPYSYIWNEKVIGKHIIKAIAFGRNESDKVSVFIINFPKRKPHVVINEIMADPKGEDMGKEWIELYNAGESIRIKDWTISNSDGIAKATLPDWVFPNNTYLIVHFGTGINDDDFSDGNGTYYVGIDGEIFDNAMDECALYKGKPSTNTIIDFVSYCHEGNYTPGAAYTYATEAGIWNEGEYFNPMEKGMPIGSLLITAEEGSSIGRDFYSNDTNTPQDWDLAGGKDAFQQSPGRCNLDLFGFIAEEMPTARSVSFQKELTIMFYMAGDTNVEVERILYGLLNKLEKVCPKIFDPNINLIFQIDGKDLYNQVIYNEEGELYIGKRGGTFRGILLNVPHDFKLVYHSRHGDIYYSPDRFVWAYHPDNAPDIGEKNTGDPAHLSEFITWTEKHYPAKRYMLIIAGHGNGWKGALPDDTNNDWLFMHELRNALQGGGVHFDIVGFYPACLMAMIEVGYQIRDLADIMIASQEIMWAPNIAYKEIFSYIQQNPFDSSENIAKKFVDYFAQAKENSYFRSQKREYTLSAVRLGNYIEALAKQVSKFGMDLKSGMEDWGDTRDKQFAKHGDTDDNCQIDVKTDLFMTEKYGDKNFIDLRDFAIQIAFDAGIWTFYKQHWYDVTQSLDASVIHERHGVNHPNSNGISIYFPRYQAKIFNNDQIGDPFDRPWPSKLRNDADSLAVYAHDFTTEWGKVPLPHPWREAINLLFRDDTQWDEFLHRYYKPCADAGPDQSFELEPNENFVEITLNGSGSSDTDGYIKKYYWDFNDTVNTDNGDWDKDGVDEANDDKDADGVSATHRFGPGRYVVTLTVWDDHYLLNDARTDSIPNRHYQTDQDSCIIVVTKKPPNDTQPPTTTIIYPPEEAKINESSIIVNGTATDNVGVIEFGYYHQWEGGEMSDSWEVDNLTFYEFVFTLALHPDWNKIMVYAKDAAGNEGNDSVTIYYYPSDEDITPPVTTEEVGEPNWENGYIVTPETPIWLNATDDLSGINFIYYEIWSDKDGDDIVETKIGEKTTYASTIEIYFGEYEVLGLVELHFYAVDNVGNMEEMNIKQHYIALQIGELSSG